MVGYYGYSKSNNAINAEKQGKFPATKCAKLLKVSVKAIKECLVPDEWHHCSSWYNPVDYYDITALLDIQNGCTKQDLLNDGMEDWEVEKWFDLYTKIKAFKEEKQILEYMANVRYLEWGGSKKYPKAIERKYDNIKVTEKGCFYTFHTKNVRIRKKMGSNGTKVERIKENLCQTPVSS